MWNSGLSDAAAAVMAPICDAVGVTIAPKVGEVASELMYGAAAIDGTRPRALTTMPAVLVPFTPATAGTTQVPGSVSVLVPVPTYGV